MKKAVIYARYSSERQTEQSIEGQLRVCNDYANRNDIIILDTYIDRAMTGTNDNRAAFQKMMRDATKQQWDYVLVYKLDRFSRDKYETAVHKHTLKLNHIKLVSAMENIPDTPEGIILESMLEGMAEYYSAELSQKVKRGLNETRLKGNFTGGYLIYGYKIVDRKVVIDEDKAKVVQYIFEQYAAGTYVKDIIAHLTEQGILNRGKPFVQNTIYNMLNNEKYTGIYRYNNQVITNMYPRIVSQKIFEIVKEKFANNHYGRHRSDIEATYLLKNKMRCGYCGKNISSETGTASNGEVKRYYKCMGRRYGDCTKSNIRKDVLENIVIDTTLHVLNDPRLISELADKIVTAIKELQDDTSVLNILEAEYKTTQKSIDNILDALEKGVIAKSAQQRLERLDATLAELETKIQVEKNKLKKMLTKHDIEKYIKTAMRKSPQLMIRLLIREIILYDDKIEIYYNFCEDPDDNEHQDFCFYTTDYYSEVGTHKFMKQRLPNMADIKYNFTIFLYI